jgi:carbon storage regulator CsrA
MLTITRRSGESFSIGDDITIHIDTVRSGQVKVSIAAPEALLILRSELADRLPPLVAVDYLDSES